MCRLNKAEGCYKLLNIPVFFFFFCFLSCKICMLKKNSKLKYIKSRFNPRLSPNPPERYWFCLCVVFDFKFTIWHLQIHKFCFFFFTYGPILSLTAEPPPSYRLLCESNPSAWCMEQMFDLPPHTPKHRNWNTVGGIISPRFTQSQMQTACEKCKVGSSEIQSKWEKVPEEGRWSTWRIFYMYSGLKGLVFNLCCLDDHKVWIT